MSHLKFLILPFSTIFCPIKSEMSGNSFLSASFRFLNTRQNWPFLAFLMNFCPLRTLQFWRFPPIFDLSKLICLVTLFYSKFQVFKNWPFLAFLINFCRLKISHSIEIRILAFSANEWTFIHFKCRIRI